MSSAFTKKELDEFHKLLLERRSKLIEEITKEKDSFDQGEGPGDLVDMATSLLEKELNFSLTEKERNSLEEIDKALERIANGTYGICIDTQAHITKTRLLAVPEALRTLKAQEAYEAKFRKARKSQASSSALISPASRDDLDLY